ncbi:helix-turn-helix domain-containing protein [Corynebacterium cystitidis]|uniref:Winged helix-turn helix n=1 Tax=Corynebacterium cystitidis DSM 20524 TaxID=1121357 RepID=A0A1H9T2L1_9CORY|nr:helix-turn-helix domain-containing protein [Corynebacterium cystitidis]WJY83436.1 hypothetical protein CCYS_12755 [Corynebacterium cystitidis DSM 20524]SER91502.1 Winged helix-turn helix [Corynebacterium cystitidis DSM 20524]SNV61583.1 Transcriptional regulators [Corynebacterium cystitidis]
MSHAAAALCVTDEQRLALEKIACSPSRAHREVVRAKVLLAAADGVANAGIARRYGVSVVTVRAWRDRFERDGLVNFGKAAAGRGRKPTYTNEDYISMLEMLFNTRPPNGDARWSTWTMAAATGMSKTTIAKIWKALGIKPHRTDPGSMRISSPLLLI